MAGAANVSATDALIPVVLSGGSGSRLWPVSRQSFPKQFCHLLDESLFTKTVKRLEKLGSPWTVTVREMKVLTEKSLRAAGVPVEQVIYEPFGRNTAPAIALLCRQFELREWSDRVAGIFPADHLIANEAGFMAAVRLGASIAADGEIVTLGVKPTGPATGYGYIETAETLNGGGLRAVGFREKPNESTAREFIARGNFYWNAGMFIFKISKMIDLLKQHAPDVWECAASLKADLSNLTDVYDRIRSVSIDYAVMERLPRHVCIPCDLGWSDLGSWDALAEVFEREGRVTKNVVSVDSEGCFVQPSGDRTYALVGVEDLLIVDTVDALLITRRGESERVKEVVDILKKTPGVTAVQHVFEVRPWGRFEVLRDTDLYKSKAIVVDPGAQISYQSHTKRSEHWIVFKGSGEVVLDEKTVPVGPGSHIYVPAGTKHRIRAGVEPLEFVEVQVGTYFGEDDIVRYEDSYGRG
jgi:mannose-1-phosphate guanylyltransferase/mannose-6-phosphate isomerase